MIEIVFAAIVGSVATWIVGHFAPGLWLRLRRPEPLRVHVETDLSRIYAGDPNWVAYFAVIPEDRWPLGSPPTSICRDWAAWLRPLGAWDGGWTEVQVTLWGTRDATVVVDGLVVTSHERREPEGIGVQCPVGGADITPRHISIDLDWEPGVITYGSDEGEAPKRAFSIKKGEVERLHLIARANRVAVAWTAELLLLVDGERQTVTIDDGGRPFKTSGDHSLRRFRWDGRAWSEDVPA